MSHNLGPRIPPHALDAERAVLGALMLSPDSLAKIADWLDASAFYRRDHQLIFRAISELGGRGDAVDAVTLGDWFSANGLAEHLDSVSYLLELASNTPSAANLVAYAEIVAEKARLRAAIDAGTKLAEAAWEPGAEASLVVAEAMHGLSQMQTQSGRNGLVSGKEAMKEYLADFMARYNNGPGLLGMPWPWREVNDLTQGLIPGELTVLGARPNMGKSVCGLQVAAFNAMRESNVLVFSLEMTVKQCMARLTACFGQIDYKWVRQPATPHPQSEEFWPRLTNVSATLMEAALTIDATPSLRIEQVVARARRAHMRRPLNLIVADHLHAHYKDPRTEQRHELGRITQAYKDLAKELNCHVLLLGQLNRAVAARADKRPAMPDLRESGEIEQIADNIFFLHREDYYDPSTHLKGIVEMLLSKGRDIPTGEVIHLQNRYDQQRLEDWDGLLPQPPAAPLPRSGGFRARTKISTHPYGGTND